MTKISEHDNKEFTRQLLNVANNLSKTVLLKSNVLSGTCNLPGELLTVLSADDVVQLLDEKINKLINEASKIHLKTCLTSTLNTDQFTINPR